MRLYRLLPSLNGEVSKGGAAVLEFVDLILQHPVRAGTFVAVVAAGVIKAFREPVKPPPKKRKRKTRPPPVA